MLILKHSLTVNRPSAADSLNAQQLWTGLMLRVLDPMRFNSNIDQADVQKIDEQTYARVLYFGAQGIQDRVDIAPHHYVQYTTIANEHAPQGQLRYTIEAHNEHGLQLLCEYQTEFPEPTNPEEAQLLEMVKNAYALADEEMLDIIRADAQLARH